MRYLTLRDIATGQYIRTGKIDYLFFGSADSAALKVLCLTGETIVKVKGQKYQLQLQVHKILQNTDPEEPLK